MHSNETFENTIGIILLFLIATFPFVTVVPDTYFTIATALLTVWGALVLFHLFTEERY